VAAYLSLIEKRSHFDTNVIPGVSRVTSFSNDAVLKYDACEYIIIRILVSIPFLKTKSVGL
jgi:hypothetical protein